MNMYLKHQTKPLGTFGANETHDIISGRDMVAAATIAALEAEDDARRRYARLEREERMVWQ